MSTLYLECKMGAAGDMLSAALLELIDDRDSFFRIMNNLGLENVSVSSTTCLSSGIAGTKFKVSINGTEEGDSQYDAHSSRSLEDAVTIINKMPLPQAVKDDAISVYNMLGQSEAKVHATTVSMIHFHEIGQIDAIVDIVAFCLLINILAPERIISSSINVGSGFVKCAHGTLPVPTPATANLLAGIPIYSSEIDGELCTPTGAALLKHFACEFGELVPMVIRKIGYGIGTKQFSSPNCVRAFWGDCNCKHLSDDILEMCCNLDDMTGEAMAFAAQELLNLGAADVFLTPIIMKKGRPAQILTCLCKPSDEKLFADKIFKLTSTLGIRINSCQRRILTRSFEQFETKYGDFTLKKSSDGNISREKLEYDQVSSFASKRGVSYQDAVKMIEQK